MNVAELIEFLKQQSQDLPVCYRCCSEYSLLEADQILIEKLCKPRDDGWIHDARPDKDLQEYLVLPGN